MTLAEFLNARIDEDEAAVQAVIDASGHGGWGVHPIAELDGRRALAQGSFIFAVMDPVPEGRACAEHAARHDPARVLREVAMKRDLLALHKPGKADFYDGVDQCDHCADQCHSGSGLMCDEPDAKYPCDTVRTLATVYADHPDYQQEWKP